MQILRRTETMQVVGHEQIIAYPPRSRLGPSLAEKLVGSVIDQPRNAPFGSDGKKDEV